MDCFYAQVEMRDNPKLKNVPLAIGGPPKTRSVLCTSNYLARKFGVKSAMPSDQAVKLCPELMILPPDFKKYSEVSQAIFELLKDYSDKIDPISLDEGYIDLSHYENASKILSEIKNRIKMETDLTCSVGLSPLKFLSKIASDYKKPDGQFIVRPDEVESFIAPLSVHLLPGVGTKTFETLKTLNIHTFSELKEYPLYKLENVLGKFARDLHLYAHGIDHREINSVYEPKSLGIETTFLTDHFLDDFIKTEFEKLFLDFVERLITNEEKYNQKIKKIFVKIKNSSFKQRTMETILTDLNSSNIHLKKSLYFDILKELILKDGNPVRLIGLGVRFKGDESKEKNVQLPLIDI